MSDKDKIRDMVMALSRGDHKAAEEAAAEVITNKTARIVENNDAVDDEIEIETSDDAVDVEGDGDAVEEEDENG